MFNIAPLARVYSDTGPYQVLTEGDLAVLVDADIDTVSLSVPAGVMAVICDLGARYRLTEIRYYHTAAASENLSFFGKQGDGPEFLWVELSAVSMGSYLSIDLSAVNERFELLKVVHTVLTGTASTFELEIHTDGSHIKFGADGLAQVYSVDSGTGTLSAEEIVVANNDTEAHTYFCLADADDANGAGLSVSSAPGGPFFGLYEAGINVPSSFSWASGHFVDTVEDSGYVALTSGTAGFYYTPVLDVSALEGRRLFWQTTISGTNELDESGSTDSVPVIGIRYSDISPSDGGWSSGQLSIDSNWSVASGTLPFLSYDNNHVFHPTYSAYLQARVEFSSPSDGQTPLLEKIGVEEARSLTIPAGSTGSVYVKSTLEGHSPSRTSKLVVWFLESRNEEQ